MQVQAVKSVDATAGRLLNPVAGYGLALGVSLCFWSLLGGSLKTLDAVASGASLIPAALDYVQPAPQTLTIALIRTAAVQ